jgi:hypothetical protein
MLSQKHLLVAVRPQRWFQVLAGLIIGFLGGLLFLAGVVGTCMIIAGAKHPRGMIFAISFCLIIAIPCLLIAGRLLSGRMRKNDGGLLSPMALRITGVVFLVGGVFFWNKPWGIEIVVFSTSIALASFKLARHRSRMGRSSTIVSNLDSAFPKARFSAYAREALQSAKQLAVQLKQGYLGTEHILWALVAVESGSAIEALKRMPIAPAAIQDELLRLAAPPEEPATTELLPCTPRLLKALDCAIHHARELGHACVGTGHLLLGLIDDDQTVSRQILLNLGVSTEDLRAATAKILAQPEYEERAGLG